MRVPVRLSVTVETQTAFGVHLSARICVSTPTPLTVEGRFCGPHFGSAFRSPDRVREPRYFVRVGGSLCKAIYNRFGGGGALVASP